ncbi:uncharacterized protein [Miscanthus floridulus]|uniref:uncharacterized protein n=1 Tax=Miscanthus floridulus TaxID=154761 RepID=UPI0034592D79
MAGSHAEAAWRCWVLWKAMDEGYRCEDKLAPIEENMRESISASRAASCLKSSKPNTIVLSGLNGSGKTTLFYQLRDGSSHQGTVTSMEENSDTFVLHSEQERKGKVKPVHIVDVPGHARLKPKLDEVLPKAAGVVFVVDAQDFLSSMQAVAEYLYDILTKATVVKKKFPVLIFCNKTDKITAHSKEFIKKQLEKELNKLQESRTAISSADISDEAIQILDAA